MQKVLSDIIYIIETLIMTRKHLELIPSICNVDESGNFQKPLKMTSLKQIYLQIEKNIYTRSHSLSNALTHHSQSH